MAEKEEKPVEVPVVPEMPVVPVVLRKVDKEDATIASFMAKKCNCKRGFDNSPCSTLFPWDYMKEKRKACHSLSSEQLDMLIMGQLLVHRRYPNFIKEYKRRRNQHRPSSSLEDDDCRGFRSSSKYYVADMPVCEFTFQFLHTLSKKRLRNIISHLDTKGPVPRVHGSKGKAPSNTFGPEKIQGVVAFIKSVAEREGHAVQSPKAKAAGKTKLPLELSKASMYRDYAAECEKEGKTPVGRSSFKRIWLDHIPSVSSSHKPVFTKSPGKAKVVDKGAGRGRKRSSEEQQRGTSKRGRKSNVNTGSHPTTIPTGGHSALNMYMNNNPGNIDGHSINLGPVPTNTVSQPMMSTSMGSHPTNTYSHSMNAGGHSMSMNTTNMSSHPMNVGSHPPDMESHPTNTDVYPTNMGGHPLSMGGQPMNMGSFLMNMGIEMCYRTNTST